MVRPLGEVLQTLDSHGFHIYDDGGGRARLPLACRY